MKLIDLRRFGWICGWLIFFSGVAQAGPPVAETPALSPEQERARFKLPPGFEIQLVAAEPDIQKPMNLAFDSHGRLWVTHSLEYPFAAADAEQSRDGLTILDGIGPDGRATKVTKFADKLNIPIGVLPMPNGREVIVWSIPNIWKLTDTDDDGKADKREVLYGPFDFVDTHGNQNAFRLGSDGWIYACHGFRNDSKIKLKGEGPVVLEMQSGNTYRFKPDGSAIEQLTWGQVNPFGMCVDGRGDLFNADCHSKPITLLLRGGYYDSFGKPHDGLGFAPIATSDDHGSTGIAGVVAYSSNHFPADYQKSMFVGNVVTNIVHRDKPQWRGSSVWIEKPEDFVTTDDWWFHPVDLQLGPDGALYICDFYNSIIGHYEVDLKHPLRDRHRGRIWRVVYTGDKKSPPPAVPNLGQLDEDALIQKLSDTNLVIRNFASNELQQRYPESGIAKVRARLTLPESKDPEENARLADERVQTLWLLSRSGKLDDALIQVLSTDPAAIVRIHLVRALAEIPNWNSKIAVLVRAAAHDEDPFVRRAAAEALGRHPDPANLAPLVALIRTTSPEDVLLIHAARIALRNQIRTKNTLDQISKLSLKPDDLALVADIALAVPNESAASFTFDYLRSHDPSQSVVEKGLLHVAKNANSSRLDEVAVYIQRKFADDLGRQTQLFQSIFQGLTQRGNKLVPNTDLARWGEKLAATILDPNQTRPARWENVALATAPTNSPWGVRVRQSSDGLADVLFFDSIVNGEALTGILRSAPFALPEKLSFWMCGHNGEPSTNLSPANHVRLKLADTGEMIAKEIPPRSDIAQKYTWDLSKWAGQKGVFEVVDADHGGAYAWIGVGRFEPSVVTPPAADFSFSDAALATAVQVAEQLRLEKFADQIVEMVTDPHVDAQSRMAAARAALNLSRVAAIGALSKVSQNPADASSLRTYSSQLLGSVNSPESRDSLANSLRTAPAPLQQPIALALAGSQEGGELLLTLIGSGRASARLLQDKPILDRLATLSIPNRDERIEELTRGIPAADERMKALVAKISSTFSPTEASVEAGAAVFKKSCTACHRINDLGGKVGPQLDGVGIRGIDRLLEDVLDPNRNVDGAFRATVIETKDGLVVTGLKLREEGKTVILGDNQGKEVRVRAEDIEEQRLSNLSPMPSNFADQLTEPELQSLIAFLLRQKQAAKKE